MSKYNLTDILNEYIGGGRIGTLRISYRDLVDKMDQLEQSGKVIVREIPGPSGGVFGVAVSLSGMLTKVILIPFNSL